MRRLLLFLTAVAAPTVAYGQTGGDQELNRGYAGWMTAWSPFRSIADLGQTVPAARPIGLVAAPAPRVGLLWTAGVPAALPFELSDDFTTFRTGVAGTSGSYRRAMDPLDGTVVQASALAWRPIAASGGAAGSMVVDQETTAARPFAVTLLPYASDPFIIADTNAPGTRRVRARLEGAFGWRVGPLGLGLSAGLEADDQRTRDAAFPRFGRTATSAVRVGLAYMPVPGLRVAVYGGWVLGSETISLIPRPSAGTVLLIAGYHEPDSAAVAQQSFFFRRSERLARAAGGAIAGRLLGADWVVFADRAVRDNTHYSARIADPPTDRFDADGWTWGAAAQVWLFDQILATGQATYRTLDGYAQRASLEGTSFRVIESELAISGELRWVPVGSRWTAAVAYELTRPHRVRFDYIAGVGSDLAEWNPSVAAALSRRIGPTTVGLGVAGAAHTAVGGIPDAAAMGPVYRTIVAPGLSLAATRARPVIGSASLGYQLGSGLTVVVDGQYARLDRVNPSITPTFTPDGHRTTWSVSLRLVRLQ